MIGNNIFYGLKDRPPWIKSCGYAFQWLLFIIAGNIFYPIALSNILQVSPLETVSLVQRSIFFIGLFCLMQALVGHRLPLIEGIAGIWFSIYLIYISSALTLGKDSNITLQEIEFSVILTGIFLIIFERTNLILFFRSIFTPIVTGSTLILISIQVSGTFLKGMLGFNGENINMGISLLSIVTIIIVSFLSFHRNKIIRSYNALIGLLIGWLLFYILGLQNSSSNLFTMGNLPIFKLPEIMAWGVPKISMTVFFTSLITALAIFSNYLASMSALTEVVGINETKQMVKRGTLINALGHVLAGLFSIIPTTPYAISAGFIALNGVASIFPFIIAALILMLVGLSAPICGLLATIPPSIAYSVTFVVFCQMISIGLSKYLKIELNQKNMFIIGFTLFTGIGLMFLPPNAFNSLPEIIQNLFSNGLLMGILIAISLEQIVFKSKNAKNTQKLPD